MALILLGKSTCPLCTEILETGQELVATSHFITDSKHPLWIYSDAGMHKKCFLGWKHRTEFITMYNEFYRKYVFGNGTVLFMLDDGEIIRKAPY